MSSCSGKAKVKKFFGNNNNNVILLSRPFSCQRNGHSSSNQQVAAWRSLTIATVDTESTKKCHTPIGICAWGQRKMDTHDSHD